MAESAQATDASGHDAPGHDYYLVDPSPWPVVGAISAFLLTLGGVFYMHDWAAGGLILTLGFFAVIATMWVWWRDVLKESQRGDYSDTVASMLRVGMGLFITSEVLFFFGFFWAFFWGALVPPETIPATWPPESVEPVPTWGIPFLNTLILLLSGTTVTWAHHAVREGNQQVALKALLLTVILGIIFTGWQAFEYIEQIHHGFTIESGMFGSAFYMATGFHGFHVIVGTTFLIVCTFRAYRLTLKKERHVGFEAASWYWHFVDVVWLFLFVAVYWWGGSLHWISPGVG